MRPRLDQQVAQRLTRFYIAALTLIAVLAGSGIVLIRQTLDGHYDDGRVLNVAGRQRMLSQRLTKLVLIRAMHIPAGDTVSTALLLQTWANSHRQLRTGILEMEKRYKVPKSDTLKAMFAQIEPVFWSMYSALRHLLDPTQNTVAQQIALHGLLRDEPVYLHQMNAIVFRFDTESLARVQALERTESLLGLATLLTVLLEGFLIFRPVVRHTKLIIKQLSQSEDDLRLTNATLEAANLSLTDTRQQLIWATEEKYRLERAEDTVRSAALLEGQENERRRFARELHDGIGQMLTGVKLQAESFKKAPGLDEKYRNRAADLCLAIGQTIQTTRHISHNLMPSVLGDFGLSAALQLLAEQTTYQTGISVRFVGSADPVRLSPALDIGLYRIGQEALNNAIKHACANTVEINLQQTQQQVTLTITDDGRGFDTQPMNGLKTPLTSSSSSGITSMRTRAWLLDGTFSLTSAPNLGTTIHVNIQSGQSNCPTV